MPSRGSVMCLLAIITLLPRPTSASALGTPPFSLSQQARSALAEGKPTPTLEAITEALRSYLESAGLESRTVSERAQMVDYAAQLVEAARSQALASAPDAETRARLREGTQAEVDFVRQLQDKAQSEVDFMGLSWGLGFGFSFGADDAVDGAVIVDGKVRVTSEKKQQPRALLEFHKFFWANDHGRSGSHGLGPFIAVAATQDKALSGVGMGLMYGVKPKATESEGFSIGAGAILDGKVKDLADGFRRNEPPPPGETEVRFEEKARWAALLFVTRTF